ncbi:hypothetical protein AVEN_14828-1 [Araneus ventricosus]|uniref:Uncharacterized protein n=1 Tax=Araneus ventricosus TaxID=182803 RepID=A0A4Y2R8G6_ARAVE|nr:hypothetical protein AVEN_14828-1 [Araneus ventricosus]
MRLEVIRCPELKTEISSILRTPFQQEKTREVQYKSLNFQMHDFGCDKCIIYDQPINSTSFLQETVLFGDSSLKYKSVLLKNCRDFAIRLSNKTMLNRQI